ncbi:MAG: HAD family phosphatase [Bacteroidota bacterium]|nr:HAD family phosphatase [Bacteroidota bacterium]
MITTVIFDLGRVLMDIDFSAFSRTLQLNHSGSGIFSEAQLESLAFDYETGKMTTDEFFASLGLFFGKRFSRRQLFEAWNAIVGGEKEGMAPIVERVQQRYRTAILSNTNEAHFQHAVTVISLMQRIPLRFLSYEIGAAKPDLQVYRHVVHALHSPPSSLLFIDDLPENISAARAAGMRGIIFQSPAQLRKELEAVV